MRRIRIEVGPGAYLFGAALLLLLPMRFLLACAFAAAFHELCHILAIRLLGGQVWELTLGVGGAKIRCGPMEPWRELVCAAAGPLGALVLLLFARWIPITALCALAQSCYNLVPIYPLDGGRMLRSGLYLALGEGRGEKVFSRVETGVKLLLFGVGIYGAYLLEWGLLPLLAVIYPACRALRGKIPCKSRRQRLQ